jgi:hypothetical protein
MDMSFTPLAGGCRCGKVRFRMEVPPIITHCCHCRDCQKESGSAFCVNSMIETDRLTVLGAAPRLVQGAGGYKVLRCPDCNVAVWSHNRKLGEAIAFVGAGALDEGDRLSPEAHYFIRSKHPWITLPDVPAFDELGDPGKPGVRARIEAASARVGK